MATMYQIDGIGIANVPASQVPAWEERGWTTDPNSTSSPVSSEAVEELTKSDLVDIAKELGIKTTSRMRKDEIEALITEAKASDAPEEEPEPVSDEVETEPEPEAAEDGNEPEVEPEAVEVIEE